MRLLTLPMRDAFAFAFIAVAMSLSPASIPMASASTTDLLTYDDARHLLNRAGFGATDKEIQRTVGMTREQAARNLLDNVRTSPVTPPPAWIAEAGALRYPRRGEEEATDVEKKMF